MVLGARDSNRWIATEVGVAPGEANLSKATASACRPKLNSSGSNTIKLKGRERMGSREGSSQ